MVQWPSGRSIRFEASQEMCDAIERLGAQMLSIDAFRRLMVEEVCRRVDLRQLTYEEAADRLGVAKKTLWEYRKELGLL